MPGTIRYKAATNLIALQGEFESDPVKVLAELVRETGKRTTITALRKQVEGLGINTQRFADKWSDLRQSLVSSPHIRQDAKQGLRWGGGGGNPGRPRRELSASAALQELADKSRRMRETTRQSLFDVVSARLHELSPYERLAAHALDVPVAEWPQQWVAPHPERVPEGVRLVAVAHIGDVSRARGRITFPGTEPSRASRKAAEIPPSLNLLSLLVPLVAMPVPSPAADKAVSLMSGEHARNGVRAVMDCFEQALSADTESEDAPDQKAWLTSFLVRAKALLRRTLAKQVKEDATPSRDFAEEMTARAYALLADPRTWEQPNGLVREWAQHVAEHPAIPAELREAARTTQSTAAAEAADAGKADSTGGGEKTKDGWDAGTAPETTTVLAGKAGSTGFEEGSDADIEVGEEADTVEPSDAATEVGGPPHDVSGETPEAAQDPERDPQAEIAALTRLLEKERSNADTVRAEHERERRAASAALAEAEAAGNRLRLRLEEEEKQRAEAQSRAHAAEAKWESARRDLEEAAQRAEAMTRQLRRRDDELRQSRQTARGASQAQLRQARIDTLRVLAAVLAEVADQAVHEAEETGPANALYRRVLARAAAAGVLDMGVLGEETDYDPVVHRAPGGPGARVVVERPGFVWQSSREPELVVLEQAIVRRTDQ
ncbi:hypothetical protein ACFY2Z_24640 [Streptomyces sp. NPDC001222]|uniref:hypothetical protein n=1 Tax=Streptomyces sp. NPDC001222 TaxID=3364548 RepID=UPI0036A2663E